MRKDNATYSSANRMIQPLTYQPDRECIEIFNYPNLCQIGNCEVPGVLYSIV